MFAELSRTELATRISERAIERPSETTFLKRDLLSQGVANQLFLVKRNGEGPIQVQRPPGQFWSGRNFPGKRSSESARVGNTTGTSSLFGRFP